jgi:hypothetical protein
MRRLILISLISLVAPTLGSAQQPTEEQQRVACEADVMKLCSAHVPDRDRIAQCMTANRRQLTPACGKIFDASMAAQKSR